MFGLGAPELLIILLIIVLLFGASKIPELGRSLGTGLSSFKKGLREGEEPTPGALPPGERADRGDAIKVEPRDDKSA